ncbi:AarF/UbiB family protein [Nocardioides sp. CER19]|uniref:ABC1 kinase family protein n=1 Tax=Nocardioides sp. CER19 TaxID=3038538 RepID=UPI002449EA51|nr:AarF/UbiB family protein [Nocardioides sp. CER19]MDH2413762.1 AarF/UbiB family protein [Nocardioides sp. CER19]
MSSEESSARRYAAIVRLLVRHGRSDLVSGAGLEEYASDTDGSGETTDAAEAFAADLEAMGPTYIKLGQLLSTRFDLLPAAYTTALSRLQDEVEPFDVEVVRQTIADELGADVRHLYADFDPEPLAAASLGQVHRATLRSGREVVVKVQRPGVREDVHADMATLARLATVADKGSELGRTYGFARLLREFERSLMLELDYRREARNLTRFAALTSRYDLLVVPEPVPDLTSGRVLTMDYIEGRKVTDVGPLGMLDLDAGGIVDQLFAAYLNSILDHGFLHADPHPGNLLVTDDGRLGIVDLGMVTSVPRRVQDKLVRLLVAIGDDNGEQAARVLADMGQPLDHYDADAFRDDVTHLVSDAVSEGPDLQAGRVLVELSRISGAHGLRPPPEMSMVGKALLNLDQSTLHLDPDFVPAEAIRENLRHILRGGLRTSPGDLVTAALDAKEFTSQLPRRANRILDSLADGQLRLRVDALDEERLHTVLQRVANRLTLGVVIAATILGASLLMQVPTGDRILGYPAIAMVLFAVAILGGAALAGWIVVTDRKVARTERRAQKDVPRI